MRTLQIVRGHEPAGEPDVAAAEADPRTRARPRPARPSWRDPSRSRHLAAVAGGRCPACGGPGRVWRHADDVARDVDLVRRMWRAGHPGVADLKLLHADGSDLAACLGCATSWRVDARQRVAVTERYAGERYADDVLDRAWTEGMEGWDAAAGWLRRHGLTPGARVLAVGSYDGSFVAHATHAGCRAVGFDVADDVVRWSRRRGCAVHRGTVHDALPLAPFDVVAVLTCLDQVDDPGALLAGARLVLRRGGRLIVRTPNALVLHTAVAGGGWAQLVAVRNHLWGQPYLQCFTPRGLEHLLRAHGFRSLRWRGSQIRPGAGTGAGRRRAGASPWLEVAARRV